MRNYKALKASGKASVRKREAASDVYNDDGSLKTAAVTEQLQTVSKCYNSSTGEAIDDIVKPVEISDISRDIDRCKSDILKIQGIQADLEQLEKDLKAL